VAAKKNPERAQAGSTAGATAQAAPTSCFNHRRRPKVATCGTCGHGLCADCVVHTPVGVKCRTCTGVKGADVASGAHAVAGGGPVAAQSKRDSSGPRRWPVALVAAGVLVLAVAGYGLVTRDSGSPTQAADGTDSLVGPVISERNSEFAGAGNLRLGGTFTLPAATPGQTTFPSVLLVPGLGALDRNSVAAAGADATRDALAASTTVSALGDVEPIFRDLAQAFAKAGVASFRYDKRGTAASGVKPDQRLSFDDEVADARAALDFMAQRQELGAQPIALLGYDQGGIVAMRVAGSNPRVKAVVLASTLGRPLADVLADDLTRTRGPAAGDEFRAALAGVKASGKAPAAGTVSSLLQPLFPAGQESYITTVMALDPLAEAKAVSVPALVVRGGNDQSLTAPDADRLAAALRGGGEVMAGGANTNRTLAIPLGHVHSNIADAPQSDQDADLAARLAGWIQTKLR
jgi:pimeloyl-ACP methyl ester carboxylesterase